MFSLKISHLWLLGAVSSAVFGVVGYGNLSAEEAAMFMTGDDSESAVLIAEGQGLYQRRCGACHSVETNRIGPKHRDVFGRKAGSQPDYNYSDALAQSDLIWNEATLDQWLANPEATISGQKMGYRLSNANERRAIIAYLRAQSENSSTP